MGDKVSLPDEGPSGLARYARGISVRAIAKGALTRFLPASFLSMTGLATALSLEVGGGLLAATGAIGFAAVMTLGYGCGLLGLRRWLYPDANVAGRRSIVAGLLSPLALFIMVGLSSGMTRFEILGALFTVGTLLALGLFFAWLTPTPERMLEDEYLLESEEQGSLAHRSAS